MSWRNTVRAFVPTAVLALALTILAACGGAEEAAPPATTPPGGTIAPTATVAPPARPAQFADYAQAVANYLTAAGGSSTCLAPLYTAWRMPLPTSGSPCEAADLDGDGEAEYVAVLTREATPEEAPPYNAPAGDVYIFDRRDAGYEVALRLSEFAGIPPAGTKTGQGIDAMTGPVLFSVADANGDGSPEAALTTEHCGAHTCFLTLYLIGFEDGAYVSLIAESQQTPQGYVDGPVADNQVRFADERGDETPELLFRQGTIASVGAGPQRESTWVFVWDGSRYQLEDINPDASPYRYFKVRDAQEAFWNLQYAEAAQLFGQAAEDPALQETEGRGDPQELVAYARFGQALSLAAAGDGPGADEALTAALAAAVAPAELLHAQMAAAFAAAHEGGGVAAGCEAARGFIEANLDAFTQLWSYGYANPEFAASELCPL